MRKLAIILGALLLLAVAAVLVAPSVVDWNRFRPEIEAAVARALGRDVSIGGELRLSLLPAPTLAVTDLKVANVKGAAAAYFLRARSLDMRVALLPLIAGRIEARSITLVAPVVELEILADGRRNWNLGAAKPTAPAKPAKPAAPAKPGAAPPAAPRTSRAVAIVIEHLALRDAAIVYRDSRRAILVRFAGLNGTFSAGSSAGPFRATGELVAAGLPLAFDLSLGEFRRGRKTRARLSLRHAPSEAFLRFDGALEDAAAGPRFAGRLTGEGKDFRRWVRTVAALNGRVIPPGTWLGGEYTFEAAISLAGNRAEIRDLSVSLRGLRAKGQGGVSLGERVVASLSLRVETLDLDRALAAPAAAGRPKNSAPPKPAAAPKLKNSAGKPAPGPPVAAAPARLTLPAKLEMSLDLTLDSLVFRHQIVRAVTLSADLKGGAVRLNQIAARLPGATEISLSGRLTTPDGAPTFDGTVDAQAGNLRGLMRWIGLDPSGLPHGWFRKASLSGDLAATAGQVRLSGLQLQLGPSRITGRAQARLGGAPAFEADLRIDEIDVDVVASDASDPPPVRAADPKKPASPGAAAPKAAPAARMAAGLAATLARVARLPEIKLRLAVGRLVAGGRDLSDARFAGSLKGGTLTIGEATVARVDGVRAKLAGTVSGLAGAPTFDLNLEAETKGGERLTGAADGSILLAGSAKGTFEEIKLDLSAKAGKGTLSLVGDVSLALGGPRYRFALQADHPDADRLLGTPGRAMPFVAKAILVGDRERIKIESLDATVAGTRLRGGATLDLSGARPRLVANLDAGTLPLAGVLAAPFALVSSANGAALDVPLGGGAWPTAPLDLSGFASLDGEISIAAEALVLQAHRLTGAKLKLRLDDGAFEIANLAGKLHDGDFTLRARLRGSKPKLAVSMSLRGASLDKLLLALDPAEKKKAKPAADGRLDAEFTLTAKGASLGALVAGLSGVGRIGARDGHIRGFDLAAADRGVREARRRRNPLGVVALAVDGLGGGATKYQSLDGTFHVAKGIVRSDDLTLVAEGGGAKGSGVIDLLRWRVDARVGVRLASLAKAPPLNFVVKGPLDNPRQLVDFKALQRYLLKGGKLR